MTLKIAYATPASAVVNGGTITLSYPTDTTAGDFAGYGHKLFSEGLQAYFSQDAGTLSVSFGASDITVTYRGATSIPANTRVSVELNIAGKGVTAPTSLLDTNRASYAPLVRLDLGAPDTADPNGILESQNLTSAGVYSTLAFDGVYGDPYGNDYAILDVPRNVVAAWTGTAVLTVTGLDEYGDVVVESSASSTSFTGKKAFKRINSIAVSANVTALTVGTGDVLGLPIYLPAISNVVGEIEDGVLIGGPGAGLVTVGVTSPSLADAGQVYAVSPVAGEIIAVYAVTNTVVATADATVTVKTAAGTVGTIVVALSDTAVGVTDVIDAIANGTVAAGGTIEFENDAAASAGIVDYVAVIRPTAVRGTIVAGVQTLPTATTGDVRGTYDPILACNGSRSFSLLAMLPDPTYLGVDNYDG